MTTHTAAPPEPVTMPLMRHRWASIAFLHWAYDVEQVQRHLPSGLRVEPWEGRAWVGLVPFEMHVAGPAGPTVRRFPETNVRTYVVGPDGRPASGSSLGRGLGCRSDGRARFMAAAVLLVRDVHSA